MRNRSVVLIAFIIGCLLAPISQAQWMEGFGLPGVFNSYKAAVAGEKIFVSGSQIAGSEVIQDGMAVYSITDEVWSSLEGWPSSNDIRHLTSDENGGLYVSGHFAEVAGIEVNRIAHYDVATGQWSALGAGLESTPSAITVHNNTLYLAHKVGASARVVTWANNEWSLLGEIQGSVYDLIVGGGHLYVAGEFSGSTAVINAGEGDGQMSHNRFCSANAAILSVEDGGTIYARYNYWPSGGPTAIIGSGSVYYGHNLGLANCLIIAPLVGGDSAREAATWTASSQTMAMTGVSTREETTAEEQLFEAKGFIAEGQTDEAHILLRMLVSGQSDVAPTALMELGRLAMVAPQHESRTLIESLTGEDSPLQLVALQVLAEVTISEEDYTTALALLEQISGLGTRSSSDGVFVAQLTAFHILLGLGDLESAGNILALVHAESELDEFALDAAHLLLADYSLLETSEENRGVYDPNEGGAHLLATGVEPGITLRSIYPNPASTTVMIEFNQDVRADVTLEVFDILGRRATGRLIEDQEGGVHTFMIDVSNLSAGTYILRATLNTANEKGPIVTRPFVVIR